METKKIIEGTNKYIANTYKRFPVAFVKGRGMTLYSIDGKEYTDFLAGVAVNILGHCHPKVVIAIQKQAQRLIHTSNHYHNEHAVKLSRLLCDHSFADKVFFANSGAEANEAAIKIARKYSTKHYGEKKYEIITALNSFHGRTMGALSATGQEKFHQGFQPMLPGFKYVAFNNIDALKAATNESTAAVMLEPIQGEGGVKVASKEYFQFVRNHCTENNILLILDEIQTGLGRTGRFFAYEHYDIEPDILTIAKALGSGIPISAMLTRDKIAESFDQGSHGATFGGGHLACAAAIASIETLLEDGILLSECRRLGAYFKSALLEIQKKYPNIVVEVRGEGLLLGMELVRECSQVAMACFERGMLINCTANNVLRFCPPLIVTEEDIDKLCAILTEIIGRLS
ncbi:MAG: aspartate aminotransferase family protein [Nitrospirae bacterium]|nr:aspartate aminotransferase family protein [Nitrospirota bacterium]MBF0541958.1 aspartate aminotransferase family protein [Nitrospirota bacterium]